MTSLVIAGAGIGGLTLAAALQRQGLDVHVYERAPRLDPVGAGITLQMNAMLALRGLGLDAVVTREGHAPRDSRVLRPDGSTITALDLGDVARAVGAPAIALHRARLQRVLAAQVDPARLHLGVAVTGFDDAAEGVRVRLEDGREVSADALVACDGLRSAVRRQLVGGGEPRYAGYTSWRGVARGGCGVDRDRVSETWGSGRRFGVVPLADDETYWFATQNAPAGQRDAPGAARETLLGLFGAWHAPIGDLLRATPEEHIVRTDIADRDPDGPWVRGRVALLGDAAHAMTPNLGQGGAQAIEDAAVLAHLLARDGDVPAALRAYEAARRPRVRAVVHQARRLGALGQWEGAAARAVRDALLARVPASLNRRAIVDAMRFPLP
jgi:2-polyprenyl-6-methoxyphenol hydroxylase-like FAD-dependent oxidoreductase